jgi:hypothetical protein
MLRALKNISISPKFPSKKTKEDAEPGLLSPTTKRHNELRDTYNLKKVSESSKIEQKEVYVDLSDKGFPGFAVQYDANKYLYTEQIVLEMLKELRDKSETGRALLTAIQTATPAYRGDFKSGVNIVFTTTKRVGAVPDMRVYGTTSASGKADFDVVPGGLPLGDKVSTGELGEKDEASDTAQENLIHRGSSANAAKNLTAATTRGAGSVCELGFTNTQVTITHELGNGDGPKNEYHPPVIVFAHELIHAWRCLTGESLSGKAEDRARVIEGNLVTAEEQHTVGIGEGAGKGFNENTIRAEMGLELRTTYGPPKKG